MLYGYKKKTKPANWTTTPAEVKRRAKEARALQVSQILYGVVKIIKQGLKPIPSWPCKPRKRIRRQSSTSRKASAGYRTKAALFVAAADQLGVTCPVVALVPELRDGFKYGHPISSRITEVHHPYGRGHGGRGPLLMDERLWIGMARIGHRYVHNHPAWARANGFLAPVGQYNMPVPLDAIVVRLGNGGIRVERNVKKEVDGKVDVG